MARSESTEFLTAFAVGTALGVGAALLLRPARPDPRARLMKRLKPHTRKMRKGATQGRRAVRTGAHAGRGMADEAIDAGRELLHEFRAEVRRIVDEAREELHDLRELSAEWAADRAVRRRGPEADEELAGPEPAY